MTESHSGRLAGFAERIGDIPTVTGARAVKAKSRDFFWYSPLLKEKLDAVTGDIVVTPGNEDEVVQVLAAAHALDLPVTPRGGGTGNYGQAMPLAGGIVLDMTRMDRIVDLRDGVVTCEPGIMIGALEEATRAELGQELRMHPSTKETATIGGFIAGGSGGVGSLRWGVLADPGNILRLRVATMEAEPRLIDLSGPQINQIHHAYGVTGIITELELPLAPSPRWIEMLVSFDDWETCLRTGSDVAANQGFWIKECGAIEGPAPHRYFLRHRSLLNENDSVLCLLVAANSATPVADLVQSFGGRVVFRSDTATPEQRKGLPHLHHLVWNHTTLRALRVDPDITYLQMGFRETDPVEAVLEVGQRFTDEIKMHVEFTRSNGRLRLVALPLVRFQSPERLVEMMAEIEALGCPIWNPHAYTLEEGNHRDPDPEQIALKRANDPKGLLNPGKMIGWEDPTYSYNGAGGYDWPGLRNHAGTSGT